MHATTTTPTGTTTTMQAIVQHRYGSADTLELATVDRPTPAADEVLVEVHAAGVDRGTVHLMTGQPYLVRLAGFGVTRPKQPVPGFDLAGRVVAVGERVTRFAVGDAVFGIGSGAFAEYAVASEEKLVHLPDGVGFEAAAVAAISGITALQALIDVGGLEPGQRVLIIGASGGVGTFALQLAVALGARVTAVAGTANLELVRSLGAEAVIDHRHEELDAAGADYDLVLDIGGRTPSASSAPCAGRAGHARDRRRRGRQPPHRGRRPPAARDGAVAVRGAAAHDVHQR